VALPELTDGIWSSDSVAHRLFVFVPGAIAGFVVLYLSMHAHNARRDQRPRSAGRSPSLALPRDRGTLASRAGIVAPSSACTTGSAMDTHELASQTSASAG
jgi:hypothetical protein